MKKFIINSKLVCTLVMIIAVMCSLSGCYESYELTETDILPESVISETGYEQSEAEESTQTQADITDDAAAQTFVSEEISVTESELESISVEKDGCYTTPEDVAEYIHTFGTLPSNFITKKQARELGWDSKAGNLREVADGMSIGGDYFGNYEGLLPEADGRKYTECDVNYEGGFRGSERIIFSDDGLIFYTDDHYESFTQLY